MTPSVSAVIVSFNSGEHLSACVSSVIESLSGLEWDAVIVDNASSDGTGETAGKFEPGFRVIRNAENAGFAKAVNQGAAKTRGALILLVNPDSTLDAHAVGLLIADLERHPECALVGPRVLEADGRVQGSARGDPGMLTGLFGRATLLTRLFPRATVAQRNVRTAVDPSDGSIEVDWVSGACMLIRRRAFVAIGGFDERYFLYWEDADLCRRLRDGGHTVRYVPAATLTHQTGRSSSTVPSLAVRAFHRSAYVYYSTHIARARLHPARVLAWVILRVRCAWKLIALRLIPQG